MFVFIDSKSSYSTKLYYTNDLSYTKIAIYALKYFLDLFFILFLIDHDIYIFEVLICCLTVTYCSASFLYDVS